MITVRASLVAVLCVLGPAAAAAEEDRTGGPYFLLPTGNVDVFPLKDTHAEVTVSGVVARVHLTQIYTNTGATPLEALYVFPASTRAAVTGLRMTLGARTIEAVIKERDQARRDYDAAKQDGRTASLLEQERPNVLQVSVANILPGEDVHVQLDYVELLLPTDGVYEFVLPAVVGPRYAGEHAERWAANPYLPPGISSPTRWDVAVRLSAGMPIKDVASPSHQVGVAFSGPADAEVVLDAKEADPGNRDFVLHYRLAGDAVQAGLLLYPGADETFFLLMVQPPARVAAEDVPPREFIFVLDVSGSMGGFPLDTAKKLMADLLGGLRPTDQFNVLLFSGGSRLLHEQSIPATAANVQRTLLEMERDQGGGGTELLPALERALALPRTAGCSRSVVLITDGYVTAEARAFDLVRKNLGQANLFTFGIGSSVNRHLVEGLARAGRAEPFVVLSPADAPGAALRFRRYVESPVLTGVTARFQGLEVSDVEPPFLPDVLAQRPVLVMGKVHGRPQGSVSIHGTGAGGAFAQTVKVDDADVGPQHQALRALWARQRVESLEDRQVYGEDPARKKDITRLGLRYGLLTAYTSFLAEDSQRRTSTPATSVVQPQPLPQGVRASAVAAKGLLRVMGSSGASGSSFGAAGLGTRGVGPGGGALGDTAVGIGGLASAPTVSGSLDKDGIQQVLRRAIPRLRRCYEQGLKADPSLEGKVVVRLTVDAQGRVSAASVESTTLNNAAVEECMLAAVRALRFPAPQGGGVVVVSYPFTFKPGG